VRWSGCIPDRLKQRRGSALIESALISILLVNVILCAVEGVYLANVYASVLRVTREAAKTVKQVCPVEDIYLDSTLRASTINMAIGGDLLKVSQKRVNRAARLALPNIKFQYMSSPVPDRSQNDNGERVGEIIISLWMDTDPVLANSPPVKFAMTSVTVPSYYSNTGYLYDYSGGASLPAALKSVHAPAFIDQTSPVYQAFVQKVDGELAATSLTEMWYEYRPLTGMFRAMLKAASGKEYRMLHAVSIA
jgi:hypothetical protein